MSKTNSIYKNGEGGYIFISHSHLDIQKVRIIRNTLEENGYEPLCFYLKCLNDNDEIEGLIKREIDSRDIFLYIESENSKNSGWVQKEREYINHCAGKTIYKIGLNESTDLKKETENILNKTRVFISYAHCDQWAARILKDKLINKDFRVFDDTQLVAGTNWADSIVDNITTACQKGCFVIILSKEALRSIHIKNELAMAFKMGGDVLGILLDDCFENDYSDYFKYYLSKNNIIRLQNPDNEKEWDKPVEIIKTILVNKKINK